MKRKCLEKSSLHNITQHSLGVVIAFTLSLSLMAHVSAFTSFSVSGTKQSVSKRAYPILTSCDHKSSFVLLGLSSTRAMVGPTSLIRHSRKDHSSYWTLHRNLQSPSSTSSSTSTSLAWSYDKEPSKESAKEKNSSTWFGIKFMKKETSTTPTNQDKIRPFLEFPILSIVPEPIRILWENILSFLPTVRTIVLSFVAGAMITATMIFVPIYNSIDKLTEPVTLFETILSDLDRAYVDPVDTTKLFETGVQAMLQSLDPYTEFEDRKDAAELSESVNGRYGGIGLVISGPILSTNYDSPSSSAAATAAPTTTPTPTPTPTLPTKQGPSTGTGSDPSITGKEDVSTSSTGSSGRNPPTVNKMSDKDVVEDRVRFLQSNDFENVQEDSFDSESPTDTTTSVRRTEQLNKKRREFEKARERGIRVVSAFEGYAFDYGMRTGDKIVAIDGVRIDSAPTVTMASANGNNVITMNVEEVRSRLRGEPGSQVQITFQRDGVPGENTVTIPRTIVQIRDVKLATLVGNPQDRIGYIQLTGFSANAGREVRSAINYLQKEAEKNVNVLNTNSDREQLLSSTLTSPASTSSLRGLILDLRSNPGGLLTSAVDVASLFVPNNSEIVSARGRGFPGILYRSRVDPLVNPLQTKLAVLINGQTASAAEIVSGAIQDLDVGIVVGSDRTFGKGLVQNVEDLPFDTALKFTVAKYYTPSGRCIQSTKYEEGGISKEQRDGGADSSMNGRYKATKVSESERSVYYTKNGRIVRDSGGIEADYKVDAAKASALEVTLLRSNVLTDFVSEWVKTHDLSESYDHGKSFEIDDATYQSFQRFVMTKHRDGELKLDALYSGPLKQLKDSLSKSGYGLSSKEVDRLEASIMREMQRDFIRYENDIKEDISNNILARYLPESMLIKRSLKTDKQVVATLNLLRQEQKYDKLLARTDATSESPYLAGTNSMKYNNGAQVSLRKEHIDGARLNVKW